MIFDLLFDLLLAGGLRGCAFWGLVLGLVAAIVLLWAAILHGV